MAQVVDSEIVHDLYPYHSIELNTFFVYGTDFKRELNIFFVPKSVQIVAFVVLLLIGLAAIILRIIRQRLNLPRNNFMTTFIDCWIPFIGGGNLQMEHRAERWFFGILLFGAFFIMSVFSGDLLDTVIQVLNAKVSNFEELADINPPIYIDMDLYLHSDIIHGMLK